MHGPLLPKGSFDRRQFIRVGAMGTMLDLPRLLQAGAPSATGAANRAADRSCIFIVLQGGLSHIDSWDLKPHAPDRFRGPYKPIATSVPGLQVGELMPRLARLADRYCVIRSMNHRDTNHETGMHVCLSGQSKPTADAPGFGSIVSKLRPAQRQVPPYVWIQDMHLDAGTHYHTGGFLGAGHSPLRIGKGTDNFAAPNFRVTAFDPAKDTTPARIQERRQLLAKLDPAQGPRADNFRRFQEKAFDLVSGPAARRAFELNDEPVRLRDHYGRTPVGQNLLAARRLIEAGSRIVSVHAFTGFEPNTKYMPIVNVWDMHGSPGLSIFGMNTYGLPYALPRLDQAVAALLEDLEQRGLLESTLVVLVGEFGRSPLIGGTGPGRDHYPACYSAMLAGAGIRGGAVHGASDKIAAFPKDSPVSPEDFGATLLHAMGIEPGTRLSPDGFTRPASTGAPILELFG